MFIILFVRNFGGVFAILFEVLLIEIQEEIHHFAGWEGGVKGRENLSVVFLSARTKRGRREGDGGKGTAKKRHDNLQQT